MDKRMYKIHINGDDDEKRAKKAFSIALEEEIEHMHDRECATPATTSSAVPLHAAVARGDAAAARALAPGRGDVDVGGGDEGEGANWPPSKGPLERIESYDGLSMRRREIGLDARNEHGDTALIVACALEDRDSCAEMVKILVDAGANLHAVSNGYAAIHWACRFGHVDAVAYMTNASKARGETVRVENIRAGDGSTPLLVAAEYGQMNVIRWLLANKTADAMARDAQGRDVLAALGSMAAERDAGGTTPASAEHGRTGAQAHGRVSPRREPAELARQRDAAVRGGARRGPSRLEDHQRRVEGVQLSEERLVRGKRQGMYQIVHTRTGAQAHRHTGVQAHTHIGSHATHVTHVTHVTHATQARRPNRHIDI